MLRSWYFHVTHQSLIFEQYTASLWCVILLNDIMDLRIPSLDTLVPQGPYGVFYASLKRQFNEVYHMTCFFPTTLIWYHTSHTGVNRLTHPYKYILASPVICSQQLSVLHCSYKKFILFYKVSQCLCFLKITDS